MISVIILTYNQQESISRSLDSVLMQQCSEEVEILVADDASEDATPDICRDYAERYPEKIRLFLNDRNKGLIDNYFDTLLECRGEYIADCAGDDRWCDPLKLEKEMRIMREHPEVTLVHTAWKRYIEETGELKDSPAPVCSAPFTDGKALLEDIITQTTMPVVHLCTALYRKDIFLREYTANRHLFRNKEYGCEDVQVVFSMALHGTIAYLPDVTLHYTISEGTISNSGYDYERQFRFTHRVSKLSHALVDTYNVRSKKIDDYFQWRIYELLMHSFRTHSEAHLSDTLECQKAWGVKDTLTTKIIKAITSSRLLWTLSLAIRNKVTAIKK